VHHYHHILVPIDFSELSEQAAVQATYIAGCFNTRITLLHIVEHFPEHLPHYQMSQEDMDPEHFLVNRARDQLERVSKGLELEDVRLDVVLSTHSAKTEIVKYVSDHKIDLIILGARGRHGLTDLLGGSTATGVVRASPCDVLTVVHRPD
jgi:universal stress protein A